MGRPEAALPRHHNDHAFFTEAIAFTAARFARKSREKTMLRG